MVRIMQENQKLVYKVNAAAAALDISRSKMYDLMRQGEVAFVCIGRDRRIPYSEILRVSTNGIAGTKTGLQLVDSVHPTRRRRLKR
jgi:excisionase family DNA binding protein